MATSLREIRDEDLELIMRWRMDPDITRFMNTNPKLTLEGQRKWLASLEKNEKVMNWLVLVDDKPVGVINLADIDWEGKNSSWGYYIGEKDCRSLKLAISLEMSLYDYVFGVLGFTEIHNEVFSLNAGVVKLHQACGNVIVKEVKGEVEKEGIKYDITHLSLTKDKWDSLRESKKYEKINYETQCAGGVDLSPHHMGYAVADINKAIEKFEYLGYDLDSEITKDELRNINIVFLKNRKTNMCIELIEPLGDNSPVTEMLMQKKNVSMPYHICYETNSLTKTIYLLKRKGFFVTSNPAPAPALGGKQVAFLVNKEAGLLELLEK